MKALDQQLSSLRQRVIGMGKLTQQMVSRRVLYANPAVNITDQLITRMNNAYQSGGIGGS